MFIIYEIRTQEHKTVAHPEVTCPLCQQQGGVHIAIRQRYIWWLGPICPTRKFGIAWCERCDEKIPNVKWSKPLEQAYRNDRSSVKTPLRLWRGMLVIGGLLATLSVVAMVKTKIRAVDTSAQTEYFAHPQVGDIYYAHTGGELKVEGNSASSVNEVYALFKVVKVDGDSVFVVQGNGSRVSTAGNIINEYTSGFWDDIEKETTAYSAYPIIISHQSMIQYRFFTPLPRLKDATPGAIKQIKRPGK
ncbi:hypothetical protein HGH93_13765 [Chitinophaga polysaccharea]|uniref:hypothetical protein n=1 Tax=Chitinophaga polysaccharea TaxID=1293035 RepID=UPI0014550912|nr:hypothetical protein [Chitinophaga polysaccharea]NLR59177.1 hypothetical protein [Chitinophaga polysaccharea]